MNYQDINSKTIDLWCANGWQWGKAISHEEYQKALNGEWNVLLTPTKAVPHDWFGNLKGKKILGLASGGGQQIPIFSALGAKCTVLDYSGEQCEREREFSHTLEEQIGGQLEAGFILTNLYEDTNGEGKLHDLMQTQNIKRWLEFTAYIFQQIYAEISY